MYSLCPWRCILLYKPTSSILSFSMPSYIRWDCCSYFFPYPFWYLWYFLPYFQLSLKAILTWRISKIPSKIVGWHSLPQLSVLSIYFHIFPPLCYHCTPVHWYTGVGICVVTNGKVNWIGPVRSKVHPSWNKCLSGLNEPNGTRAVQLLQTLFGCLTKRVRMRGVYLAAGKVRVCFSFN